MQQLERLKIVSRLAWAAYIRRPWAVIADAAIVAAVVAAVVFLGGL